MRCEFCGHTFDDACGRYGCPNCHGEGLGVGSRMSKPRKGKGTSTYNQRVTNDTAAAIWALTDEGLSQRAVAGELGIAASTVGAELARDPVRLASLRGRIAEERAARYKEMESKGQQSCLLWLGISIKLGQRATRKGLGAIPADQLEQVAILPRLIQVGSQTAERSTKASNLLTGKPTERVAGAGGSVGSVEEMNEDELLEAAIEAGLVDRLPPWLRAEAEKRVKRGA